MTETAYAALVTNRSCQRLTDRDPDILDGVMIVDMQITLAGNAKINQTMTGDLIKHMLHERHTDAHVGNTRSIKIQRDTDPSLECVAFHFALTLHTYPGLDDGFDC